MEFKFSKDPAEKACQAFLSEYFEEDFDKKGTFQDFHAYHCQKHSDDDMLCGECLKEIYQEYADFILNSEGNVEPPTPLVYLEFLDVLFNFLVWMERRYIHVFEVIGKDATATDHKEILKRWLETLERDYEIKISE